jgi:prepilin-type processing-associated H-X9-DG protein
MSGDASACGAARGLGDWNPIKPPGTGVSVPPAHAKGVNVLYADTHAPFSPYSGRVAWDCFEDWWADHSWEGYFE